MNPAFNERWSAKILTVANAIFRFGPLVIVSGTTVYVGLHEPYYREVFSRPETWHWFYRVSVAAVVLTGLLFAVTVGVFAFNPDWHTVDGLAGLLRCLFFEAIALGILAGLGWLVAAVWPLWQ